MPYEQHTKSGGVRLKSSSPNQRSSDATLADAESEIGDEAPMMLIAGGEVLQLQLDRQLVVAVAGKGFDGRIFVPDTFLADVEHHAIDFRFARVLLKDEFGKLAAFVQDGSDDNGFEVGGQLGSRNLLAPLGDNESGIYAIENHRGKISELGGLVVEQADRGRISFGTNLARDAGVFLEGAGSGRDRAGIVQQSFAGGGNRVDAERIDGGAGDVGQTAQQLRLLCAGVWHGRRRFVIRGASREDCNCKERGGKEPFSWCATHLDFSWRSSLSESNAMIAGRASL